MFLIMTYMLFFKTSTGLSWAFALAELNSGNSLYPPVVLIPVVSLYGIPGRLFESRLFKFSAISSPCKSPDAIHGPRSPPGKKCLRKANTPVDFGTVRQKERIPTAVTD